MQKYFKRIAFAFIALAIWSSALVGVSAVFNSFASQQVQSVAVHQLDDNASAYTNTVASTQTWSFLGNMLLYLEFFGVVGFILYIWRQFSNYFKEHPKKKEDFEIK